VLYRSDAHHQSTKNGLTQNGGNRVATHLMMRLYETNSIKRKTPSDGGGKIIRLYPRAIAFRDKAALPVRDKNVIRLPQIASMPQKGARQQTRSQRLSPIAIVGVNDDHHHRMLENALASAVLAVLVISGIWIVSIPAAVP